MSLARRAPVYRLRTKRGRRRRRPPSDVRKHDEAKGGHRADEERYDVLQADHCVEVVSEKEPEDAEECDTEPATEVGAVCAGDEQRDVQAHRPTALVFRA